jgi:hypothetical protein
VVVIGPVVLRTDELVEFTRIVAVDVVAREVVTGAVLFTRDAVGTEAELVGLDVPEEELAGLEVDPDVELTRIEELLEAGREVLEPETVGSRLVDEPEAVGGRDVDEPPPIVTVTVVTGHVPPDPRRQPVAVHESPAAQYQRLQQTEPVGIQPSPQRTYPTLHSVGGPGQSRPVGQQMPPLQYSPAAQNALLPERQQDEPAGMHVLSQRIWDAAQPRTWRTTRRDDSSRLAGSGISSSTPMPRRTGLCAWAKEATDRKRANV